MYRYATSDLGLIACRLRETIDCLDLEAHYVPSLKRFPTVVVYHLNSQNTVEAKTMGRSRHRLIYRERLS